MSIRTMDSHGRPIHRCSNQDCGKLYSCNSPWGVEKVDGMVHARCDKLCKECRKA